MAVSEPLSELIPSVAAVLVVLLLLSNSIGLKIWMLVLEEDAEAESSLFTAGVAAV